MRVPWALGILLPLSAACSSVLGYDDVSFEGAGGGAAVGGSVTSGGGGAPATGGTSGGGAPATGGATSGGAPATGGASGAPAGGGSSGTTGDPLESYRQACVDEINNYRSSIGLAPYARWSSAEPCADGEAKSDSESGQPHGAFPACGEGAQNECPGYPSLDSIAGMCLAQMWAEGPGSDFSKHGHYINMSSTSYSKVACGFYVTPSGSVWAVQDFQ